MFTLNVHVEHKLFQSFKETNQGNYSVELNTFFFT